MMPLAVSVVGPVRGEYTLFGEKIPNRVYHTLSEYVYPLG
jgi:hypothetical protein